MSNETLLQYRKHILEQGANSTLDAVEELAEVLRNDANRVDFKLSPGTTVELQFVHPDYPGLSFTANKTTDDLPPINIGVFVEGGVVQKIVTDKPNDPVIERLTVAVIDEDTRTIGDDFLSIYPIIEATEQDLGAMGLTSDEGDDN